MAPTLLQADHSNETTIDRPDLQPCESFDSVLPFLVCAQNPALNDPSLPLPELKARLRYDVSSLPRHERAVLAMHVAAGHALDPVSAIFTGSPSARALTELRAALRSQGWQSTRLGGRQFASPDVHIKVAMRWQLQKAASGRPLRLPRPFGRLLSRVERLANELITWRFRYHLRLSPSCSTSDGQVLALAGVHTEILPVFSPSGARRLRRQGLHPEELRGWLRHTVIDWNKSRNLLESDLKAAGVALTTRPLRHGGVYQGIPFDGRVLIVSL